MRSYAFIVLLTATILLMIMSSQTTTMAQINVPHKRDKRFLFGLFSNKCRKEGKRCFGINSKCCSGHCKHHTLGSDRCA